MLYLGWIIAAFLAGVQLTAWRLNRRRTLRSRFDSLGVMKGWEYADIVAAVQILPRTQVKEPDGQVLRTWQENGYAITLLFDEKNVCRGVMEEMVQISVDRYAHSEISGTPIPV